MTSSFLQSTCSTVVVLSLASTPPVPHQNVTTRLYMPCSSSEDSTCIETIVDIYQVKQIIFSVTLKIASKAGTSVEKVKNVIIWGNHSSTQYPDVNHGTVILPDGQESSIRATLKDDNWLNGDFIKVRKKKHFFYWHLFVRCYCTDLCISHVTYCTIVLYLSFNVKSQN